MSSTPPRETPTGLRRIFLAFGHTARGLRGALRTEAAFRQELALAAVLVPIGIAAGEGGIERALLVGSVILVLIVELLNTGVEKAIDRIGLEHHELSGFAKDLGSAAVFLAFVLLAAVWGFVLLG